MFAIPPFLACPANAWTTIYRGMVLPFGILEITAQPAQPGSGAIPLVRYHLIFATPPYYYEGTVKPSIALVTGPTPWCELAVRPERDWNMRATGY
jgi:hypothetical protein